MAKSTFAFLLSILASVAVMPLAAGCAGGRHVVVTRIEPITSPNIEWCQFEDRPEPERKRIFGG
jgi:hypothetical protein